MNLTMIRNWNSRVSKEDTVFFLGDFCMRKSSEAPDGKAFEYFRDQLNGSIIFLQGNHDVNNGTKTIIQNLVIKHGGDQILLVHDPKYIPCKWKLNFCGHVHDKWKFMRLKLGCIVVNVSMDQWKFAPVNINEIISELSRWRKQNVG